MKLKFEKYHGNGNDFVIIDDRNNDFDAGVENVRLICDRRFGIGADGLMLVKASSKADFEMQYFNSDGHQGTMCGNGGRCIAAFAFQKGIANKKMVFDAVDGVHEALINKTDSKNRFFDVSLQMQSVEQVVEMENAWFLDTGSPHHVEFVACANSANVDKEGKKIRFSDQYKPAGTNVNFVEIGERMLFVRTFERGVEEETLSCGTGVVASAMAAFLETGVEYAEVKTVGGDFRVSFKWDGRVFTDVWLHGPAKMVFKGEIEF